MSCSRFYPIEDQSSIRVSCHLNRLQGHKSRYVDWMTKFIKKTLIHFQLRNFIIVHPLWIDKPSMHISQCALHLCAAYLFSLFLSVSLKKERFHRPASYHMLHTIPVDSVKIRRVFRSLKVSYSASFAHCSQRWTLRIMSFCYRSQTSLNFRDLIFDGQHILLLLLHNVSLRFSHHNMNLRFDEAIFTDFVRLSKSEASAYRLNLSRDTKHNDFTKLLDFGAEQESEGSAGVCKLPLASFDQRMFLAFATKSSEKNPMWSRWVTHIFMLCIMLFRSMRISSRSGGWLSLRNELSDQYLPYSSLKRLIVPSSPDFNSRLDCLKWMGWRGWNSWSFEVATLRRPPAGKGGPQIEDFEVTSQADEAAEVAEDDSTGLKSPLKALKGLGVLNATRIMSTMWGIRECDGDSKRMLFCELESIRIWSGWRPKGQK